MRSLRIRATSVVSRALDALPPGVQVRLSGRPQMEIDGQTLDPGAQVLLALRERFGPQPAETLPVEQERAFTREEAAAARGRVAPVAGVRDIEVPGAAGPLPARHYVPSAVSGAPPLLVYFHGGGWVLGDLDTPTRCAPRVCRSCCGASSRWSTGSSTRAA
jgi:acetyl esterase